MPRMHPFKCASNGDLAGAYRNACDYQMRPFVAHITKRILSATNADAVTASRTEAQTIPILETQNGSPERSCRAEYHGSDVS